MKKVLYFIFFSILSITLIGCNKDSLKLGPKSNYEINHNTISMTIDKESISNTGMKMKMINNSGENYEYGAEFSIEYQKKENWYSIIPKDEMNFNMMAYLLEDKMTKDFDINWEASYGKLPKGKYRIVKSINRENSNNEDIYIAAEFLID